MKRVLCIFSHILGNRTLSDVFADRLRLIEGIQIDVIPVSPGDYQKYPAGRIARLSGSWEAAEVVRRKFSREALPPHDGIIFNGYTIALELVTMLRLDCPIALQTDTTPKLIIDQQITLGTSLPKRILLELSKAQQKAKFARVASKIDVYLPSSNWCRDSLVKDYGIDESRCLVTSVPRPLSSVRPSRSAGPLRLLFVGNDFRRKGGELLLQTFSARLHKSCTLTIVSNDPLLETMQLPPGVTVRRGLKTAEEVAGVYPAHDVFVLPTRLDQFAYVIAEAAAAGVPSIVTDVGGVKDIVKHEQTGLVLPLNAGPDAWADAVERFIKDVEFWRECSDNVYALASQQLSLERLDGVLQETISRMFARS